MDEHSNEMTSSAALSHDTITVVCSSNFESVNKSYGVSIEVKALQQCFHTVL